MQIDPSGVFRNSPLAWQWKSAQCDHVT